MSATRRRELMMMAAIAAAAPAAVWAKPKPAKGGARSAAKPAPSDDSAPHLAGLPEAPKRFVLFGSYSCAFTAELEPMLRKIQADHPKAVAIEWRHFPLHLPDPATHAMAQTLKGDAFWGFTDALFASFIDRGAPPQGADLAAIFTAHAGPGASLPAAYADQNAWAAVKRDLIAGRLLGVTMTPGLFVDGYFMTPDGLPLDLETFEANLRAMVAQA